VVLVVVVLVVDGVVTVEELIGDVDVLVDVVVEVVLAQEAKTIAKIIVRIVNAQIILLFIFLLHFARVIEAILPHPQSECSYPNEYA